MKRSTLLPRVLSLALCLVLLTGLLAIPAGASYTIYVNAKDGVGLNLRSGPGTEYSKLRSNPIPMYTALTISQTETSAAGNSWGYTSYEGTSGWVCLVETTTYDPTPQQAAPAVAQPETSPAQEDAAPAVPDQAAPTVEPAPTAGEDGSALTTMALGIIIGLLAAILILLVVLSTRKKKNN